MCGVYFDGGVTRVLQDDSPGCAVYVRPVGRAHTEVGYISLESKSR